MRRYQRVLTINILAICHVIVGVFFGFFVCVFFVVVVVHVSHSFSGLA